MKSKLDLAVSGGGEKEVHEASVAGGHVLLQGGAAPMTPVQQSLLDGVNYFLHSAQLAGIDEELAALILRETADRFTARQPRGRGLTESEAAYLVESGAFTEEGLAEAAQRIEKGDLARQEQNTSNGVLTRALLAEQVSEMLGIDRSRVRHRQAKNNLFGFLVGRVRLYPRWQFDSETHKVIPHLAEVVDAFPQGWLPASIEGFMTTPQRDLRAGIEGVAGNQAHPTPVEWLFAGGDPEAVVEILEGIRRA